MKVYNSLEDAVIDIREGEARQFFIFTAGVLFPLHISWKGVGKNWVVFYPGAYNRSRDIPSFQRRKHGELLDCNVLCVFDPGLFFHKKITLTWFSGTPSLHYSSLLADVLSSFFYRSGIDGSRILLFGSSGGGLPAFETAMKINNSSVMVFNIQINASKHPGFGKMYDIMFPDLSRDQVFENYRSRFFLPDIIGGKGCFSFFYLQNLADESHYAKHYSFFKKWFLNEKGKGNLDSLKGDFILYEDLDSGHGSIGKEAEVRLIESFFSGDGVKL
ncbi:hypothetical protein [Halomonas sp. MS1]|nr:hypothetical protein [Halomonas sp. MS1]UTD55535.1 hypothetical protein NF683_20735 [Halomonas sp. MS1]